MDRAGVEAWVEGYERAWRSPGTDALAELFAEGASYKMSPYHEPFRGLVAIAEMWERERKGPDEPFELASEVVAVDGDRAVVFAEVSYGDTRREYRDLWVLRFDAGGLCTEFEEWPFAPGHDLGGPGASAPQ